MGFFGCQLLEIAVKSAKTLNRKAIRDILFKMEADTVAGPYKVEPLGSDDSGLQVAAKCWLIQWQKKKTGAEAQPYKAVIGNYVREVIWPDRYKTADPIYPFPAWER